MPIVDPRPLVERAQAQRRAIVGANVSTAQMARGVISAAQRTRRPVLVQFNRSGLSLIGGAELAAAITRHYAAEVEAEVGLHLDHADTLDELTTAINAGFGSLMIDGSTLPLDQHVTLAQSARGLAAWSRLPIEAELGHVAGDEAGVTIGAASWTDAGDAARFVEATGIDWLAVSVGNTHGGPAHGGLQVDRLRSIRDAVSIPLVLHGASGLTDAELEVAVGLGVAKVNVGTALHQAAADGLARSLTERPSDLRSALRESERAVEAAAAQLLTAPWAMSG